MIPKNQGYLGPFEPSMREILSETVNLLMPGGNERLQVLKENCS